MRTLIHDYETASAADLKKCGAWVYAEHPSTEIICLSWCLDDGPARLWIPGEPLDELRELALAPDVLWVAHNAAFERSIYANIMIPVFGMPSISGERWHDTMAVCAYKSLPLALEKAASVLRLSSQKDKEGRALTLGLSRLNRKGYYGREPEKLQRVYTYCKRDVEAERELHRRIKMLSRSEREVWKLDQKINQRGVRLDMNFVAKAQKICDDAARPLLAQFSELTNGLLPSQGDKFKAWLLEQGCPFPRGEDGEPTVNLQKETINKILGDDDDEAEETLAGDDEDYQQEGEQLLVPYSCRRSLRIRKVLGSASIKKLRSMQACVGSDGRARWLLQYHGAGPGRWAGRLLQPQNFPRPTLKIGDGHDEDGNAKFIGHDPDQLVQAILTGDADYVRLCFGEPIEAVSNGLRHALVPEKGNLFEVGDFAQIEARIVLALAGQHDKTDAMAKGQSPYIPMAEAIFKKKVDKHVDVKEYTIGKNTVLGCGFQMGWRKFLARYCPKETPEFAQRCIKVYREEECPRVPKLWYALEDAAVKCVWDKTPQEAYGIRYQLEDGWLTCRLPSGRKLWYYDPQPVRKAMPWNKDIVKPGFTYRAWKMGQWKLVNAYGGLLTENVVQATARDMLVNALFNSEEAGHPVVLTVHDEDVNEVPAWMADAVLLKQMMKHQPGYIIEMRVPVDADCWVGDRYRK